MFIGDYGLAVGDGDNWNPIILPFDANAFKGLNIMNRIAGELYVNEHGERLLFVQIFLDNGMSLRSMRIMPSSKLARIISNDCSLPIKTFEDIAANISIYLKHFLAQREALLCL